MVIDDTFFDVMQNRVAAEDNFYTGIWLYAQPVLVFWGGQCPNPKDIPSSWNHDIHIIKLTITYMASRTETLVCRRKPCLVMRQGGILFYNL